MLIRGCRIQWFQSIFRCRILMGCNITAPYMEMLHVNRSLHYWITIYDKLTCWWMLMYSILSFLSSEEGHIWKAISLGIGSFSIRVIEVVPLGSLHVSWIGPLVLKTKAFPCMFRFLSTLFVLKQDLSGWSCFYVETIGLSISAEIDYSNTHNFARDRKKSLCSVHIFITFNKSGMAKIYISR